MSTTLQLRLTPDVAAQSGKLRACVAGELAIGSERITDIRIRRRSLDARQRRVFVNLTVEVYVDEPAPELDFEPVVYPDVSKAPRVVVVGAGPGGLFAALRLIELGYRPVVLERGRDVHARRRDISLISREQTVNPESNYSFGEGGAGAYSDGKLYTRSKKRGSVDHILRIFCQHGASTSILVDAHPHIGTDKLPRVIEQMREQIKKSGGEVHFEAHVCALVRNGQRVVGVQTSDGREFIGPVVLATGHSARDVYHHLVHAGAALEAKGLAVGVRLEHPSALIDRLQYHSAEGRGRWLPAAEYSMTTQSDGRGVYSFCMCPGGVVVPAATGPEQVVVNGMSPSNRGSAWSNSGMVVELRPEDLDGDLLAYVESDGHVVRADDPLRMMAFQEVVEKQAWQQGGRSVSAPAQRMTDFVRGRLSATLPKSSYSAGLLASPLHFWLPPFVSKRLQDAFAQFGRRTPGFLTQEAIVIAAETRTSSPVRILRDPETLQNPLLAGLFPCGEGAGYAGGIVSAAIDGERCAEAAARYLNCEGH